MLTVDFKEDARRENLENFWKFFWKICFKELILARKDVNLNYKGDHRALRLCKLSLCTKVNVTADNLTKLQIN